LQERVGMPMAQRIRKLSCTGDFLGFNGTDLVFMRRAQ
jgi:hypothetical protein